MGRRNVQGVLQMIKNFSSCSPLNFAVFAIVLLLSGCGGGGGGGDVTTDTSPNTFVFTDQTGIPTSTLITSNTITVSGITDSASIAASGGAYSINGGSFITTAGTVSNNDTVAVRHTSSSSSLTTTNTTLTIGGISDIFSSTTVSASSSLLWGQGNWDASNWN